MNFSYSITLKHGSILHLDLVSMHDFAASCIGYLEKFGSLDYLFLNVDPFLLFITKKITSIYIIASQIRKILKDWKTVKLIMVDKGFLNFGILLKA